MFGRSWASARVLSSLVGWAACLVLIRAAWAVYGKRVALYSLFAFAMCAGVQIWFPVAKNITLATLFLAIGLDMFVRRRSALWAAVFIGFSALTRLTFAPAGLVLLIPLTAEWTGYRRQLKDIIVGCVPMLLVAAYFLALDPFNVWQDNVLYHQTRTGFSDAYLDRQRIQMVRWLMGFPGGFGLGGLQLLFLVCATVYGLRRGRRGDISQSIMPITAAVLTASHLIPSPTHMQYFSVATFLLVPPAVSGLVAFGQALRRALSVTALKIVPVTVFTFLIAFGAMAYGDLRRFLVTGDGVEGVGKYSGHSWRLAMMPKVSAEIDRLNINSKPVVSSWPGYLVEARSHALSGTENHFGYSWVGLNLFNPDEQDLRHVMSHDRAVTAFVRGDVDLVVVYNGPKRSKALLDIALARGGTIISNAGWVTIVGRKNG